MRTVIILHSLLLFSAACGGLAVAEQPAPGSEPASSGGSSGAGGQPSPSGQIQAVDPAGDAGGQFPTPPGSSFFWRGGLGNWFVSSITGSRDATIADVIPPRGDSAKAYHVTQTTQRVAVDLWAQLRHPEGTPVDLSAYTGVSFWARLDSPSGDLRVAFGANGRFDDVATLLPVPQKLLQISGNWVQYQVQFADVGQDASAVSSIDFVIDGSGGLLGLWVDDLGFTCRGSCPK